MPAKAWMQATVVMQATPMTPARLTAIAPSEIEGTQAAAGMKATTGPPTQYGRQQKHRLFSICSEKQPSRQVCLGFG